MTKIMLVEDDSTMRSLLKTLIDLEGFDTYAIGAMQADDLITSIADTRPDALLLDVHLQSTNGLDVLQKIRQHPQLDHLPVAMISGEDLAAECLSAGADKFILKPFDTGELINWLKKVSHE
jgi:two-component system, sensor histidine kinase and response regulator